MSTTLKIFWEHLPKTSWTLDKCSVPICLPLSIFPFHIVIFNNPIPNATRNTANISDNLGFFIEFFIANATNIVKTIVTGLVKELNTTEFEDKWFPKYVEQKPNVCCINTHFIISLFSL